MAHYSINEKDVSAVTTQKQNMGSRQLAWDIVPRHSIYSIYCLSYKNKKPIGISALLTHLFWYIHHVLNVSLLHALRDVILELDTHLQTEMHLMIKKFISGSDCGVYIQSDKSSSCFAP